MPPMSLAPGRPLPLRSLRRQHLFLGRRMLEPVGPDGYRVNPQMDSHSVSDIDPQPSRIQVSMDPVPFHFKPQVDRRDHSHRVIIGPCPPRPIRQQPSDYRLKGEGAQLTRNVPRKRATLAAVGEGRGHDAAAFTSASQSSMAARRAFDIITVSSAPSSPASFNVNVNRTSSSKSPLVTLITGKIAPCFCSA